MDILGIDNVLFAVGDLNEASDFYQKLGFLPKFRLDILAICVLSIGFELPGLVLRKDEVPRGHSRPERARFWVEVPDTGRCLAELKRQGIPLLREPVKLPTGLLVEVADPWGNVVGFTDHLAQPASGRRVSARKAPAAGGRTRKRPKRKGKK